MHLAFGGVAPKTITAPKTEALLRGQPWTEEKLTAALGTLSEDVWISPDAPGELAGCFSLIYIVVFSLDVWLEMTAENAACLEQTLLNQTPLFG